MSWACLFVCLKLQTCLLASGVSSEGVAVGSAGRLGSVRCWLMVTEVAGSLSPSTSRRVSGRPLVGQEW